MNFITELGTLPWGRKANPLYCIYAFSWSSTQVAWDGEKASAVSTGVEDSTACGMEVGVNSQGVQVGFCVFYEKQGTFCPLTK